jgi:hypothetical protein
MSICEALPQHLVAATDYMGFGKAFEKEQDDIGK